MSRDKPARRNLYLHGFGSDRASAKGLHFRDRLAEAGVELELLDLNVPSFERQTYTAILAHLDEIAGNDGEIFLGGSSMGGYLAARWAELRPERVTGLFLLCPGFDLTSRWPLLLGEKAFGDWQTRGFVDVERDDGPARRLHWEFVRDARQHPAYPEVCCPCRIVHGTADEIVPIEFSRNYASGRAHVRLIEVDDDHRLLGSLERLTAELLDCL